MNHCTSVMELLYIFLTFMPVCCSLRYYSLSSVNRQDHATLQFSNIKRGHGDRIKKRETDLLPSSLNLHITTNGKTFTLLLQKTSLLLSDTKVYPRDIINKENIRQIEDKTTLGYYHDKYNAGSFHLECLTTGCETFEVVGTFFLDNEFYAVEPDLLSSPKNIEVNIRPNNYSIFQFNTDVNFGIDYVYPDRNRQRKNAPKTHHTKRREKRATGTYNIELLIAVDYSIYKFWYDLNSNIANATDRKATTITDIKRYFAFLINGVNNRYQTFPGSSFVINIVFAGIYIAETESQAPFTQNRNGIHIDADTLLADFKNWSNTQVSAGNIPNYDHAMLFTRYNLTKDSNRGITGYAYQSALCSSSSVSVVQENFNFISQTVAAHELGHSLGAIHDGVNPNTCDSNSGYIMRASTGPLSGDKARNPWLFSSCSTTEVNDYIDSLTSNCMLSKTSSTDENELNGFTTPRIGQIYNVDEQCELILGTGSTLCRSLYNDSTAVFVCTGMFCSVLDRPGTCVGVIPAVGTTCGDKKWCSNGQCVYSEQAPSTGGCVFGDEPGIVMNGKTCVEIKETEPHGCYSVSSTCCVSCNAIKTNITGCEFGDKIDCSSFQQASSCYDDNFRTICCKTCSDFETGIPDCKYGDKVTSCTQANCALNADNCCGTCYEEPSTTTVSTTILTTAAPTTTKSTTTAAPTTTVTSTTASPTTTSTTTSNPTIPTTTTVTTTLVPTTTTTTQAPTTTTTTPVPTTTSTTKAPTTTTTTPVPTTTTTTQAPTTTTQAPTTTTTPIPTTTGTTQAPSTTTTTPIPTTTSTTQAPTTTTTTTASTTHSSTTASIEISSSITTASHSYSSTTDQSIALRTTGAALKDWEIGLIAAGVLVVLLIVVLFCWCARKSRTDKHSSLEKRERSFNKHESPGKLEDYDTTGNFKQLPIDNPAYDTHAHDWSGPQCNREMQIADHLKQNMNDIDKTDKYIQTV